MGRWIRKHLITIIPVTVILVGAVLMAYPTFSDWWNSFHQSRAVASYVESVANMDRERYKELIDEADAYNAMLSERGIIWQMSDEDKEEYNNVLMVEESGIMGYIDVPKIGITLPIYHGTGEAVLQVAIGHIEGSSLPVGGEGTHCIVSGHRGLPSARLFTDLDKIAEGDTWTMTVLDRTVTYEADQIRVVLPNDLSNLKIEQGEDYCTLVTCTPYGINTHRLLVRGHRIENAQGEAMVVADALIIKPIYIAPFIGGPIILILLLWMILATGAQRRSNKALRRVEKEIEIARGVKGDGSH